MKFTKTILEGIKYYIDKIKVTADNAQTTASNAQVTADNAKSAADNAQTTASNAQVTADNAYTAAYGASHTADEAKSAADNAQVTANKKMNYENPIGSGSFSMNRSRYSEIGDYSHAEGCYTAASGLASHTEGYCTTASGLASHAEGYITTASGSSSHAEGYCTVASGDFQHVQGKFNKADVDTDGNPLNRYAHIIGNGEELPKCSNAHTVDWDGNAWYSGTLKLGGTSYDDASEVALKSDITSLQNSFISFAQEQNLTDEQKTQARANISAEGFNWHEIPAFNDITFTVANDPETNSIIDWDAISTIKSSDGSGFVFGYLVDELTSVFTQGSSSYKPIVLELVQYMYDDYMSLRNANVFSESNKASFVVKVFPNCIIRYLVGLNNETNTFVIQEYLANHTMSQIFYDFVNDKIVNESINHSSKHSVSIYQGTENTGKVLSVDSNGFVTTTELGYIDDAISDIQEQLDSKAEADILDKVDYIILNSSTSGSTKKFKLTIDDDGVLTATEIVESTT